MATLAVSTVEQDVMDILGDELHQRFSKREYATYINEVVGVIIDRRPDAAINDSLALVTVVPVTSALSGNVSLGAEWQNAIVEYVVAKLLLKHGGQTENVERSANHMANFDRLITR